jgi:hypothetical protein
MKIFGTKNGAILKLDAVDAHKNLSIKKGVDEFYLASLHPVVVGVDAVHPLHPVLVCPLKMQYNAKKSNFVASFLTAIGYI